MTCSVKKVLSVLMGVVLFVFLTGLCDNDVYAKKRRRDRDKDGLTNREERRLGTNPRRPDTDGDGIMDSVEVDIGTDPLDSDSDDDGLNDGDEILGNTNPNDDDSDDDGISDSDDPDNNPIEDEFESALHPIPNSSLLISTFKEGEVEIEGENQNDVEVEMHIKGVQDATIPGGLFSGSGNTLCIDATLVDPTPPFVESPVLLCIPFTINNGVAWVEVTFFDIGSSGQYLRINSVLLKDLADAPFAEIGIIIGGDDDDDGSDDNSVDGFDDDIDG